MNAERRLSLFSLALVLALLAGALSPAAAFADEGTPPAETPAESTEPPVEETAEPPAEESTETESEPVSVPEVLEGAPEDTELVVLDEAGESLPLATEEAAEILLNSDPVWCPTGQTPGGAGCTPNQASVTALITYIQTNAITGNGTIFFQDGAYGGAETDITFDHDDAALSGLGNLALEGGWDLGTNTKVGSGTTTFSVPFAVLNWTGDVSLVDIVVNADDTFAALNVVTAGNISVDNVSASGNTTGSGAYLDTCQYDDDTGLCAGTGDVTVTDSNFNNNNFNGLVTVSAGNTGLTNVGAVGNGLNGAQITGRDADGTGNVSVTDSWFLGIGNGSGLDVESDGNITLYDVSGTGNNYGALLDSTFGAGNVSIIDGSFDDNDFDGLSVWSANNVFLTNTSARRNARTGAYLDATYGNGSIQIQINSLSATSSFNDNGEEGLIALTADGDITLNDVSAQGNELGAWLKSFDGGDITVIDSTFSFNDLGLLAVTGGQVTLNNVTANNNTYNGVEVYSLYTYACFGGNNIVVEVIDGTYQGNGEYGLYVAPGATGSLIFTDTGSQTFGGNGLGDYLLDLADPDCSEPGKPQDPEEGEGKEPNIVQVPFEGGDPVEQDCELFSSTILQLPNGTWVEFGCPFEGFTMLEGLTEDQLPGTLGAGAEFLAGLSIGLLDPDQVQVTFNEDGTITITFLLPEGAGARSYDILYWDPSADGGAGSWVTLPQARFGQGVTPLNPDDPTDGRRVKSGVRQDGRTVSTTVNFTGVFVLVER